MANPRTTDVHVFDYNGSGVYLIRCLVNGKVYVGSSLVCRRRVTGHFSLLEQGRHRNRHLQFAWDRYGSDSFECSLLETCAPSELRETETHWVAQYDALDPDCGFNFQDPATSISPNAGPVKRYVVYPPTAEPLEIENLHLFCRQRGLCSANLTLVAQGKSGHHKGWLCRYADEPEGDWLRRRVRRNTKLIDEARSYRGDYIATAPDGVRWWVVHLASFCKERGLPLAGAHASVGAGWRVRGWKFCKAGYATAVDKLMFCHRHLGYMPARRPRPEKGKPRHRQGIGKEGRHVIVR